MLNTEKIKQDLTNACYSHDAGDSKATALYNEIAGDLYPDKSFSTLVESIKKINPKLAQLLNQHGIDFKLIAHGDSYTASGWEETSDIGCCTESWYHSDRDVAKVWQRIECFAEDKADEIREALSQFEAEVTQEVIDECRKRYGEFPTREEIEEMY